MAECLKIAELDKIIDRSNTLCTYGNATHIPELAEMIFALANEVKTLAQAELARMTASLTENDG